MSNVNIIARRQCCQIHTYINSKADSNKCFFDHIVLLGGYLIGVHDGEKSVGNGQDRAVAKLAPYSGLDEPVRLQINVGSRLVHDQHRVVAHDRAGQADKLSLADAHVRSALLHHLI